MLHILKVILTLLKLSHFRAALLRPTARIVLWSCLLAAPSTGWATEFPWLGSSGDAGFKDLCPAGQFLVGLSIRSGSWMDRLAITCGTIGNGTTSALWHGPTRGGNGGGPSEKTCPPGLVITFMGLVFTPGQQQIKYFRFGCMAPGGSQNMPLEIGAPATVFPDVGQQCPPGEAAYGLQGRFGQHVNAAGLECARINGSPPPTPPPPVTSGLPPAEWADMLKAHNDARAGHCAAPLTWNAQLAAEAQAYADQCNLTQHGSSGENLADFTAHDDKGNPILPAASNAQAFQKAWYCELNNYVFAAPVFTPGFTQNCAPPVNGHFTQVVWKDTRQLGCGKATCTIGGVKGTHWVCRYLPAGNVNATDPNVLRREVLQPPCP